MNIVDKCREIISSLSDANQQLVTKMLAAPNAETWDEARRVAISQAPLITLEMAVKRISNENEPVTAIPDPFTIYRALRYAAEKSVHYAKREIEQTTDIVTSVS